MKRVVLLFALCFGLTVIAFSCRDTKKETQTEASHNHEEDELVMHDAYVCPMDCEKGKTYVEESNCPVCKMVLKKVEDAKSDAVHEMEHDKEGHHDHDKDSVHGEH
ncbi:hypothetical protein A9Q87_01675 [Flavobacteriales bacterium 34_180_T64]|nr:hypothetical protein A9Q87_01675 [Flavobacteriales bacterium 34_180_T64]